MTTANTSLEKKAAGDVEMTRDRPVYAPLTDIYEKEDAILVRCDMPGVDQKDLDVTLEDNVLTIRGNQAEVSAEGRELLMREFGTGVYERAFTILPEIESEKISARIKNGVLDIQLPKSGKAQPKKIAIQAE